MPADHTNSPQKCAGCIIKPYPHKPGPKASRNASKAKNALKTSLFSNVPSAQQNLTLHDWLRVVDWYDTNQPVSQEATVNHFKHLRDDALVFNQGTLSHHLTQKGREQDNTKLVAMLTALSSKRVCIVTRPDVEEALRLWVQHMESKRETVSQAMLVEKRAQFEDMLAVPESEKLGSCGWVQKFLQM